MPSSRLFQQETYPDYVHGLLPSTFSYSTPSLPHTQEIKWNEIYSSSNNSHLSSYLLQNKQIPSSSKSDVFLYWIISAANEFKLKF